MTCPEGKRAYRSKREALEANARNGHALRAYRCELCSWWHIAKRTR